MKMTITREDQHVIGRTFEQDADEFFSEMAEPVDVVCPFQIYTKEEADIIIGRLKEEGYLTDEAFVEAGEMQLPIKAGTPIKTGHTKGYILLLKGKIEIKATRSA